MIRDCVGADADADGVWFELNWPKDNQFVEPASSFNLAMAAT